MNLKQNTLFKQSVDKEMDDLFAQIAPGAQREVGNAVAKSNIVDFTEPISKASDTTDGPSLFKQPS